MSVFYPYLRKTNKMQILFIIRSSVPASYSTSQWHKHTRARTHTHKSILII